MSRIRQTKVDPKFFMRILVENPFSSKYGFKAISLSVTSQVSSPLSSSLKINGLSHRSVQSKSIQIKPRRAPQITLARPGTEIETRLNMVRNDISLILPQNHQILQELFMILICFMSLHSHIQENSINFRIVKQCDSPIEILSNRCLSYKINLLK